MRISRAAQRGASDRLLCRSRNFQIKLVEFIVKIINRFSRAQNLNFFFNDFEVTHKDYKIETKTVKKRLILELIQFFSEKGQNRHKG